MTLRNFVLRILINAIAIAIAASLIPGIEANSEIGPLIAVGLVLTLVNALLKPILLVLSCPAVLLTLGLFILVINGVILMVAGQLVGDNLLIDGFGAAFFGGLILSIVNMVLEGIFGIQETPQAQGEKGKR